MKLTSHLILMQWLLKHTFILPGNTQRQPIKNTTIKNIFFKEFPEIKQELNKEINLLIGQFLKYIYGSDLIKYDAKPIKYNIGIVKNPIKEIFIKDYFSIYNIDYYYNANKYNFNDVKYTYKTLNNFFSDKQKRYYKPLTPKQFIKIDNLSQDIIIHCLNKGIPKNYLRYFLFYTMCFLNPKDLNLLLSKCKQDYKVNRVCAICGASENLTVHHIKEVSKAPHLEYNNQNFIVLCQECHIKHHQEQHSKSHARQLKEVL